MSSLVVLIYFSPHIYSLQCHYQAIILTFQCSNKIVCVLLWFVKNISFSHSQARS